MDFLSSRTRVEGYPLAAGYIGMATMVIGLVILLPLAFLPAFPDEIDYALYFIGPGAASITIGYLLSLTIRGRNRQTLGRHQDSVIITATLAIAIFMSSVPFVLKGDYTFSQALFETTSGLTTTGLSIVDVEACPKLFLIFRSLLQFIGGTGFMLVIASLFTERNQLRLYLDGDHQDRIISNFTRYAPPILLIYSGFVVSGALLYIVSGMNWFDALNHAISAVTTGGFSTKAQSIGSYDSIPIEAVTMALMLLGSTSFLVHLLLLKGKVSAWIRHCETRTSLLLLALGVPLVSALLLANAATSLPQAFRLSIFQIVSAFTTTGLRTAPSLSSWPSATQLILIILMLIGGSAGSTAGGIKQARVVILFKATLRELRNRFNPRRVLRDSAIHRFGFEDTIISEDKARAESFVLIYLVIFLSGTFAYTLFGYTIQESAFEFASALGTVGLSTGITRIGAPAGVLWIGMGGMVIGRLEFYIAAMGLARIVKDGVGALRGRKYGS